MKEAKDVRDSPPGYDVRLQGAAPVSAASASRALAQTLDGKLEELRWWRGLARMPDWAYVLRGLQCEFITNEALREARPGTSPASASRYLGVALGAGLLERTGPGTYRRVGWEPDEL